MSTEATITIKPRQAFHSGDVPPTMYASLRIAIKEFPSKKGLSRKADTKRMLIVTT